MSQDIEQDLEIVATLPPMHLGEMRREACMLPQGLRAGRIAKACGVPRTRIERIAREEIGITADTALRLGRYFGTTPQFWLTLQSDHDMLTARGAIGDELARIAPLRREAA